MQRLASNLPNRIKQPAQCCVHCGKSYVKKTNLTKHVVLCDMLHQSKKKKLSLLEEEEDQEETPSQQKMYAIMLEFGQRFQKLEEKVEELSKWTVKTKRKVNIVDWLNANCNCEQPFDTLTETIEVTDEDVIFLFKHNFLETWNELMKRSEKRSIAAFVHKPHTFYVYVNNEDKWVEASREMLTKFFNRLHMKIIKRFSEWKKTHRDEINHDESLSLTCDHASVKLMAIDFREDAMFGKIKGALYTQIKKDMTRLLSSEEELEC